MTREEFVLSAGSEVVQEISILEDARILEWLRAMMERTTISVVNRVNPRSRLLQGLPEFTFQQATVNGTVACFLRTGAFPEALVARALEDEFLLVASSANLAFKGNNYRVNEIPKEMLDQVDYKLDLGALFRHTYDRGHYERELDYNAEPPSFLRLGDREWTRGLLSKPV